MMTWSGYISVLGDQNCNVAARNDMALNALTSEKKMPIRRDELGCRDDASLGVPNCQEFTDNLREENCGVCLRVSGQ